MADKKEHETFTDDQFADYIAKTFMFALFMAIVVVAIYVGRFWRHDFSDSPGAWGEFGDYVGGVINPIVGLVTAFLVLISVSIQRKELRASVKEMKAANESTSRMSFEQSLFAWLGNYHALLAGIRDGSDHGRDALEKWFEFGISGRVAVHRYSNSRTHEPKPFSNISEMDLLWDGDKLEPRVVDQVLQFARNGYSDIYRGHRSDLDAPLRTLYRLISWIDKHPGLDQDKQWHYVSLVRAQLSWIEMAFLYYNAMTSVGAKFAELINEYALFDNLDLQADPLLGMAREAFSQADPPPSFAKETPALSWPFDKRAFSSDEARASRKARLDKRSSSFAE